LEYQPTSLPAAWVNPLNRFTLETSGLTTSLADITGSMQGMITSQAANIGIGAASVFSHQVSANAAAVSTVLTHANNYLATVPTLATTYTDAVNSPYLAKDLMVGSTTALFDSAASMATAVHSATGHLCTTMSESLKVAGDGLATMVPSLTNSLQTGMSSLSSLIDTSLATTRLNSEIFARPITDSLAYLSDTSNAFTALGQTASSVYSDLATLGTFDTKSFLFNAPTIEPYAASQVAAMVVGVDETKLDECRVEDAEELLGKQGDELHGRLRNLKQELADVYQEGINAIKSGHSGWIRHAGVSFRTLFDHLLRQLAPDAALESFFHEPQKEMQDGKFTRSAQLRYIFRDVATGSYARMAEEDIKIAQATFFPSNEVVHRLSSPLTDHQMRVLWRRIQGSVSVVLEVAGY